jgi:hypothetical protein
MEVNLNVGGPTDRLTVQATTEFLDQSRLARLVPCAALMLRHALRPTEIEAMIDEEPIALQFPRFLEPVNRAMQTWWQRQPQAKQYRATDLVFNSFISPSSPPHYDQLFDRQDRPTVGPLTVVADLAQNTTYYLHSNGLSCFSARGAKDIQRTRNRPGVYNRGLTITSYPGDVLLIPNIYPAHHQSVADEGRLAATYETRLKPIDQTTQPGA